MTTAILRDLWVDTWEDETENYKYLAEFWFEAGGHMRYMRLVCTHIESRDSLTVEEQTEVEDRARSTFRAINAEQIDNIDWNGKIKLSSQRIENPCTGVKN